MSMLVGILIIYHFYFLIKHTYLYYTFVQVHQLLLVGTLN